MDAATIQRRRWSILAVLSLWGVRHRHGRHDRQRGPADASAADWGPRPASCNGSWTPTPLCSPACCWRVAAWATASAASRVRRSACRVRRRSARRLAVAVGQLIAARAAMGVGAALIFPATLADAVGGLRGAGRAGEGDRHLGGRSAVWGWRSGRSSAGCCSSTSVGLDLPGERPDRRASPSSLGRGASCRTARPARPGASTRLGRPSRSRRHALLVGR